MKLKFFNPSNVPTQPKGKPFIHLSPSGIFSLSIPAANTLGVKAGSHVMVAQDEDSPKDWYIIPSNGEGFPVRGNKDRLIFNSVSIAKLIFQSYAVEPGKVRIPLATEPTEIDGVKVFTLLTSALKKLPVKQMVKVA